MSEEQIVITGASSSVGEALARHFAQLGRQVAAIGRSEQRLAALAAGYPRCITTYSVDIRDRAQVMHALLRFCDGAPLRC